MLGFIQNHEDLSRSRLKPEQGLLLKPKLDVASQMAGIVGASTNNRVGMAGIDLGASLQSYQALLGIPKCQTDCDAEEPVTVNRPNGTTETYYLNLYRFSTLVGKGRGNGVDIHLFSFGLPSAQPPDYSIPEPEDDDTGIPEPGDDAPINLPDPPDNPSPSDAVKKQLLPAAKRINSASLCGDPWGLPLTWLLGDCTTRPNPYQKFSDELNAAVSHDNAVVVGPAGDLDADGDLPVGFVPGLRDRYALTVGGGA